MSAEHGLVRLSRKDALKASVATLVVFVPVAALVVSREVSKRREKERVFAETSSSSGDFGAIFPADNQQPVRSPIV